MSQEYLTKIDVEALLQKQEANFQKRLEDVAKKTGFITSAVVYNPSTKFTYEDDGVSLPPKYDVPIMDHEKWMGIFMPNKEQKAALAAGTLDKDREEDCYSDEYLPKYQEMKSQLSAAYKNRNYALAGSVITSMDFSGLTTNLNLSKVVGFQITQSVLSQAVTTQQAPNLQAKYRTWTGIEVETNVPEGVIVEAKKASLSERSYKIKKDVGAVAITIEGELTIDLSVQDVFGEHVRMIAEKMLDERNNKLAAALANTTYADTQTGSDFGPFTAGVSNNDPGDEFMETVQTLADNHYTLNTIISAYKPKKEYFANTYIKGLQTLNPPVGSSPGVARSVAGIETSPTWFFDAKISPITVLYALDSQVFITFEGPKRQVEIQRPDAEVREYYSRDFNTPFIIDPDGIVLMTGVTA
jgi:hypothetical protein